MKNFDTDQKRDDNPLAAERTDMAEDRTLMANERTFAGWMRTGLACLGMALGFEAVFGKIDPAWAPKIVASGFAVIALLIFYAAHQQAMGVFERLDSHDFDTVPKRNVRIIASVMALGAVGVFVGIWFFDWSN